MSNASSTNSLEQILQQLRAGKLVIITDDEARENEGDLMLAAEFATVESIAFMLRYTSGIICVAMEQERLHALDLPQMVPNNSDPRKTAFTVSVDAEGVSTGISAQERTRTILALVNPTTTPQQLRRPGHVFPLCSRQGGVLKRAGHTEAGVDLMHLASLFPACVLAELTNDDGTVMRKETIEAFARTHQIPLLSVAELIRIRRKQEKLVVYMSQAQLPTDYGLFTARVYRSLIDDIDHIALVLGDLKTQKAPLVRVHSECLTGDVFGSRRCDCGSQLHLAMEKIAKEGCGVIVYLRKHEGRGIGLAHKMRAYNLQDQGKDTVEANEALGLPVDSREYGIGAHILADLGIHSLRLLTNNPAKYTGLAGFDLDIVERIPLIGEIHDENRKYLLTKKEKLGHII